MREPAGAVERVGIVGDVVGDFSDRRCNPSKSGSFMQRYFWDGTLEGISVGL